ncbi:helix-turn-helix domain-containing protein [Muricoccus radiodurans]|uniref:helix-turn-helix domain-containing protein n=1 Tax=Muricoccus radiodurans TaxID=2231721 RepID=UPI003CEB93E4
MEQEAQAMLNAMDGEPFASGVCARTEEKTSSAVLRGSGRAAGHVDVAVGARIRSLRLAASMTQKDLSEKVGVTNTQLHRYERGATRLSASRLLAVAEVLGVSLTDLTGESSRATPALDQHRGDLLRLQRAYMAIPDANRRRALLSLADSMANEAGRDETAQDGQFDIDRRPKV